MSDDIVARLRGNVISRANQLDAAEAIEWYRAALGTTHDCLIGRLRELERGLIQHRPKLADDYHLFAIGEAADEIERLRAVISRNMPR